MAEPRLTLVETPTFARRRRELLDDEQYRLLQLKLAENPDAGALIRGGGGLRKLRWELEGRGKRGGARVIYYWATKQEVVLLLFLYPKNEQADLMEHQLQVLARLVREEFK
jgi:mRNA-degrading endonuclease RelE of RelBE toxin-antitoxin system